MGLAKSLEQKFLFPLTRALALTFIIVLLVAIVVLGIKTLGPTSGDSEVSANEVMHALNSSHATNASVNEGGSSASDPAPDVFSDLKISPSMQERLMDTPHNKDVLRGWLDSVPYEARQEFIDELSNTLTLATKAGIDDVDAINKYKQLKFTRLEKVAHKQESAAELRTYLIAGAFGCLTLVALFSLTLVLLSIERNTRHEPRQD